MAHLQKKKAPPRKKTPVVEAIEKGEIRKADPGKISISDRVDALLDAVIKVYGKQLVIRITVDVLHAIQSDSKMRDDGTSFIMELKNAAADRGFLWARSSEFEDADALIDEEDESIYLVPVSLLVNNAVTFPA